MIKTYEKYLTNKNKPDYIKFSIGDYVKRKPWGIKAKYDNNIYQITHIYESDIIVYKNTDIRYIKYNLKNMTGSNDKIEWEQSLELLSETELDAFKFNL